MADMYDVPKDVRGKRILELANRFEMTNALGDPIQSYSHGMRQKIMIMGVLVHNPEVWILDEPLTGLDPKSSFTLKEMMREHADSGRTVFFRPTCWKWRKSSVTVSRSSTKGKFCFAVPSKRCSSIFSQMFRWRACSWS